MLMQELSVAERWYMTVVHVSKRNFAAWGTSGLEVSLLLAPLATLNLEDLERSENSRNHVKRIEQGRTLPEDVILYNPNPHSFYKFPEHAVNCRCTLELIMTMINSVTICSSVNSEFMLAGPYPLFFKTGP